MKLKPILFIVGGFLLVGWATSRVAAEILPIFQPTSTPDETVVENFAPNTGPLAHTQPGAASTAANLVVTPLTPALPFAPPVSSTADPAQPLPPTLDPNATPGTPDPSVLEGAYLGSAADPSVMPTPDNPAIPDRIVIPAIHLDAPVLLAASQKVLINGKTYYQWLAPDKFAVGWHTSSAYLGQVGNTVLDGHHNIFGKVFGGLVDLVQGDKIDVYSGERVFHFVVVNRMILPERDVPIEKRLENARWLAPSDDIRLTLITCWPAYTNTHRLIIVAVPDPEGAGG